MINEPPAIPLVLGRHPEAESLHASDMDALDATIDAIKPGATTGEVDEVRRKVIERSGRKRVFRHPAGMPNRHQLGRGRQFELGAGCGGVLEVGMPLHMSYILFGECGYMFETSERILVSERGAEILSRTPHTLHRA